MWYVYTHVHGASICDATYAKRIDQQKANELIDTMSCYPILSKGLVKITC